MRAVLLSVVLLSAGLTGCVSPIEDGDADSEGTADACETVEPSLLPEDRPERSVPTGEPRLTTPPTADTDYGDGIERDDYGVPQIEADSTAEVWGTLGYAQAEDRLWQMELVRRFSQGTLAEVLGEAFLPLDIYVRTTGLTPQERAGVFASLEEDTQRALQAYVQGVNERIEEVRTDPTLVPAEFQLHALEPSPWRVDDVLARMTGGVGQGLEDRNVPLVNQLLDRFDEGEAMDHFNDLVPKGTPDAPPTIPPEELAYPPRTLPDEIDSRQRELLEDARPVFEGETSLALEGLEMADTFPLLGSGSSAVAVSGEHTATGEPLLMGGPQVGLDVPADYWEADISVDGARWHVFQKPGQAFFRGQLDTGAYVLTTAYADMSDLVVLKLDPDDPDLYLYGNESRAFDKRMERFAVANRQPVRAPQPSPDDLQETAFERLPRGEVVPVYRSHLGPVLAVDEQAGLAVTVQQPPSSPAPYLDFFMDEELPAISQDPTSLREGFEGAFSQGRFSGNAVAAFSDGTIAHYHWGRMPVRDGDLDPRLPRPGDPSTEWQGWWGWSCMPTVEDPDQGYLVNWNNNPAQNWPNLVPRPWLWGPSHRVDVLDDAVAEATQEGPIDAERLNDLRADVATKAVFAGDLVPGLLDRARATPNATDAAPALDAIEAWAQAGYPMRDDDGDGRYDHAGLAAYEAWREILQDAIFEDELGKENPELDWAETLEGANYDHHGSSRWSESVLAALLAGETRADWFDDVTTQTTETAEDVLSASMATLMDELQERHGPSPEDWKRPVDHQVYSHLGAGPDVNHTLVNRGTINYIVDFGTDRTRTVLTPGQSGDVRLGPTSEPTPAEHSADQVELYTGFEWKTYDMGAS